MSYLLVQFHNELNQPYSVLGKDKLEDGTLRNNTSALIGEVVNVLWKNRGKSHEALVVNTGDDEKALDSEGDRLSEVAAKAREAAAKKLLLEKGKRKRGPAIKKSKTNPEENGSFPKKKKKNPIPSLNNLNKILKKNINSKPGDSSMSNESKGSEVVTKDTENDQSAIGEGSSTITAASSSPDGLTIPNIIRPLVVPPRGVRGIQDNGGGTGRTLLDISNSRPPATTTVPNEELKEGSGVRVSCNELANAKSGKPNAKILARNLFRIVFGDEYMANHSLSGKTSPANKHLGPPSPVADRIHYVVKEFCGDNPYNGEEEAKFQERKKDCYSKIHTSVTSQFGEVRRKREKAQQEPGENSNESAGDGENTGT